MKRETLFKTVVCFYALAATYFFWRWFFATLGFDAFP